jgi:hypothetical protein
MALNVVPTTPVFITSIFVKFQYVGGTSTAGAGVICCHQLATPDLGDIHLDAVGFVSLSRFVT